MDSPCYTAQPQLRRRATCPYRTVQSNHVSPFDSERGCGATVVQGCDDIAFGKFWQPRSWQPCHLRALRYCVTFFIIPYAYTAPQWSCSMAFRFQRPGDFLEAIRAQLQSVVQLRNDHHKPFLSCSRLEEIWSLDRLVEMAKRYNAFEVADIPTISAEFLQTISILVYINWHWWNRFRSIFIACPCRTDKYLLTHDLGTLAHPTFLGSWGQKFFDSRYMFCTSDNEDPTIDSIYGLNEMHTETQSLKDQNAFSRAEYHEILMAIHENLEDPSSRAEYHSILTTIQYEEAATDNYHEDDITESGIESQQQSSVFDTASGGAYTSTATTSQAQTKAEEGHPALSILQTPLEGPVQFNAESGVSPSASVREVHLDSESGVHTSVPDDRSDAETTFSTGSGIVDRQRRYIRAFIDRLSQDIKHTVERSSASDVPSSYLGSLLKVFSWKLHAESTNPFQWEASVILRQKQTEILDLLVLERLESDDENNLDIESVNSYESQADRSETSEHKAFAKPRDMLSQWISNLELPVPSAGEQHSAPISPSQEDISRDMRVCHARDEPFFQLPDYERFISASDAYQWLLLKIHQHGHIALDDPSVVSNIGKTLRNRLRAQQALHKISRRKASLVSMAFEVDWNPIQYLTNLGMELPAPNVLERILCLTGTWNEAQAMTVVEYLRQTWPVSGEHMIALMHKLIELPEGQGLYYHLPGPKGAEVRAKTQPAGKCCVTVIGSPYVVAEIGEQIGWLASALRVTPDYMQGVVACLPDIVELDVEEDNKDCAVVAVGSCRIVFNLMEKPKVRSSTQGFCWGPLFSSTTMVSGYPILQRDVANTGLEMSLGVMATLIRTQQVVQWGARVIMKGFSWLAVASRCTSGTTVWHLLTSAGASQRISYIDPRLDRINIQVSESTSLRFLEGSRHIVGWCSNATEYCGRATALHSISASGLPSPPPSIVIDRLYLEGGTQLVGGFNMRINKKERPFWLERESDYPSLIKWISLQPIVFYDISDCRAWLVDGVSALLHLVRISLHLDGTDPESPYDWVFDSSRLKDTWTGSCIGRLAALKTLTCWDNLRLPVYVKDNIAQGNQQPELQFSTFGDRVKKVLHSLEILLDRRVEAASQDGIKISQSLNPHKGIVGFDILDVINPLGPIHTRIKHLPSRTHGWTDFTQSTGVTTIFGSGFGDLIRPTDLDAVCSRWKSVPTGLDYLATSVSTLNMLHEKRLQRLEPGLGLGEMTNKILWISPESQPFKVCECLSDPAGATLDARCHLHPVQYLVSKKPWKPNILPRGSAPVDLLKLEKKGAVIFGHLSTLRRWKEHAEAGEAVQAAATSTETLPIPVHQSSTTGMNGHSQKRLSTLSASTTASVGIQSSLSASMSTEITQPSLASGSSDGIGRVGDDLTGRLGGQMKKRHGVKRWLTRWSGANA